MGCVVFFTLIRARVGWLLCPPNGSPHCHYPYDMISKHAFHVYTSDLVCLVDLQRRMRNKVILFNCWSPLTVVMTPSPPFSLNVVILFSGNRPRVWAECG